MIRISRVKETVWIKSSYLTQINFYREEFLKVTSTIINQSSKCGHCRCREHTGNTKTVKLVKNLIFPKYCWWRINVYCCLIDHRSGEGKAQNVSFAMWNGILNELHVYSCWFTENVRGVYKIGRKIKSYCAFLNIVKIYRRTRTSRRIWNPRARNFICYVIL